MKFQKIDKATPYTHILLRLELAGPTMFLGCYHPDKERFVSDEGIEFTYNQLIKFEAQYLNPYLIKPDRSSLAHFCQTRVISWLRIIN